MGYAFGDDHPSRRAPKVFEFVRSTKGKLRLFFLPPYSPELNPDELVWNHLKNQGVGKRTPLQDVPAGQQAKQRLRSANDEWASGR